MKIYISILLFILSISFSYAQCDTAVNKDIIESWILTDELTEKQIVEMDTFLEDFQVINPIYKNSISNTNLGNIGLANVSNIFFDRKQNNPFFLQAYDLYFLKPEKNHFFNTKKPYTNLSYAKSGSKGREEELLKVIHTQNVNPFFNVGFMYNLISSVGKYNRQEVKNNSYSLWTSYEKNRYSISANWNGNKFRIYENGGLSNDDDFISGLNVNSEYIDVNLDDAKSEIKAKSLLITQIYDLGEKKIEILNDSIENEIFIKKSSLIHKFQLERKSRLYIDELDTTFYSNIFIDSTETYDSSSVDIITNTLQWNFNKKLKDSTLLFCNFNVSNEILSNYYYNTNETLNSSFLGLSAGNKGNESFLWKIKTKLCFAGYKNGNYNFDATFNKYFKKSSSSTNIGFNINYLKSEPDYFLQNYFSNYFSWNNDFVNENKLFSKIYLNIPAISFNIGINYAQISNFIFFDKNALPSQNTDKISVISANFDKSFKFWRFTTKHKFVYQYSDSKDISLPEFSCYSSVFYEQFILKKVLRVQFGTDFYYNTNFYSDAFMPSTNTFYLQDEKLIGDHPFFDLFINIKLKTVRFFFKYSHINSELGERNYFSAYHYPLNPMTFKSGLSWTFYD